MSIYEQFLFLVRFFFSLLVLWHHKIRKIAIILIPHFTFFPVFNSLSWNRVNSSWWNELRFFRHIVVIIDINLKQILENVFTAFMYQKIFYIRNNVMSWRTCVPFLLLPSYFKLFFPESFKRINLFLLSYSIYL